jgi:serine carboxypeptidase-like clade 1
MAADNVEAIVGWYEKFPEFKKNDLYISGESYAGIYVPFTVNAIHHHNAVHTRDPNVFKPNLKGMMVGNGVTSTKYDSINTWMEMAYYHSLYPGEVWEGIQKDGCMELFQWDAWRNGNYSDSPICQGYYNIFTKAVAHINIYNIEGTCWGAKGESQYGLTKVNN